MEAKKALVEKFRGTRDERVAMRHLAAAYLLASTAYLHAGEFEELLRKYGLFIGGIKQGLNRVVKELDKFFPTLSPLIKDETAKAYWADMDELAKRMNEWVHAEPAAPEEKITNP